MESVAFSTNPVLRGYFISANSVEKKIAENVSMAVKLVALAFWKLLFCDPSSRMLPFCG